MTLCKQIASLALACAVGGSAAAVTGCGGAPPTAPLAAAPQALHDAFGTLTPQQLWQRLRDGRPVRVFDNNRPETYAMGRVPGAIPLALGDVSAARLPADKDITLVFYCSNEH